MNWNLDYVLLTPLLWLFIVLLYGWGRANREGGKEEGREEGKRPEKLEWLIVFVQSPRIVELHSAGPLDQIQDTRNQSVTSETCCPAKKRLAQAGEKE